MGVVSSATRAPELLAIRRSLRRLRFCLPRFAPESTKEKGSPNSGRLHYNRLLASCQAGLLFYWLASKSIAFLTNSLWSILSPVSLKCFNRSSSKAATWSELR
jgi:hypothetical protein